MCILLVYIVYLYYNARWPKHKILNHITLIKHILQNMLMTVSDVGQQAQLWTTQRDV